MGSNIGQVLWGLAPEQWRFESHKPRLGVVESEISDNIQSLKSYTATETLANRIQVSSPDYSIIDGCIGIRTSTKDAREDAMRSWSTYAHSSKIRIIIFGTAMLLTGVGTAINFSKMRDHPLVQIAFCVSIVASFILAVINVNARNRALGEVAKWERPHAERIAEMRTKAYEMGFLYIYKNNLKLVATSQSACMHPEEVRVLFDNYLDQYCTEKLEKKPQSDAEKTTWLDGFKKDNPVSETLMKYAYGEIPPLYREVCEGYKLLVESLSNSQEEFKTYKTKIQNGSNEIVEEINRQREKKLEPLKTVRDAKMQQYTQDRDSDLSYNKGHYKQDLASLKQNPSISEAEKKKELERLETSYNEEKIDMEAHYNKLIEKYHNYYELAANPINLYFDNKIETEQEWLTSDLEQLAQKENSMAPYCYYAQNLLTEAFDRKNSPDHLSLFLPRNFSFERIINIPLQNGPFLDEMPDFKTEARNENEDDRDFLDFLDEVYPSLHYSSGFNFPSDLF